jgi:hypothetical protein
MKTKLFRNNASVKAGALVRRLLRLRLAMTRGTWVLMWLLLPLLGRGLGGGFLFAQNGVTVTNLAVNSGTVTFTVSWSQNTPNMPKVWLDSVWVFVDYNDKGTMKRLELLPGATLTATSAPGAGQVIQYGDNNQGVWVVGNAKSAANSSKSFSATVKLLTATTSVAGACAYASNYPPVAKYITAQTINFTGTPPYDLVLSSGTTTAYSEYNLLPDQILQSFTDKTGAPGILPQNHTLSAASTKTWNVSVGSVTLTWSDYVQLPRCMSHSVNLNDPESCGKTSCANAGPVFSSAFVLSNSRELCPPPWHLPTVFDMAVSSYNGTGIGNTQTDAVLDRLNALGMVNTGPGACHNYFLWLASPAGFEALPGYWSGLGGEALFLKTANETFSTVRCVKYSWIQ